MIHISKKQYKKIADHARSVYPNEMCGVLTKKDFIPVNNVAKDKTRHFEMDKRQYAKVVDSAVAIVHSHIAGQLRGIDPRTPSQKDLRMQTLTGLPWLIVATDGADVTPAIQIPRIPSEKYEDRPFIWHINDCYTLVQDYYLFQMDIELPNADKNVDPVHDDLDDVFAEHVESYGFYDVFKLEDIKNGDLVLLDSMGKCRNHLGIFHDEMILHQVLRSGFYPLSNFTGRIHRILRYVD